MDEASFEKFLNGLEKETLARFGQEGKRAAIVSHLDGIAATVVQVAPHMFADRTRVPGSLRYATDCWLIAIDTPVPTSFLRDKDGDNEGSWFHRFQVARKFSSNKKIQGTRN